MKSVNRWMYMGFGFLACGVIYMLVQLFVMRGAVSWGHFYFPGFLCVVAGAVIVFNARRKGLLSEFEKNGAVSSETAVTLQEIYDNWPIRAIKPLRMRALTMDTRFLHRRGNLVMTDDGKYYLAG